MLTVDFCPEEECGRGDTTLLPGSAPDVLLILDNQVISRSFKRSGNISVTPPSSVPITSTVADGGPLTPLQHASLSKAFEPLGNNLVRELRPIAQDYPIFDMLTVFMVCYMVHHIVLEKLLGCWCI
jgi:hypothetical protein